MPFLKSKGSDQDIRWLLLSILALIGAFAFFVSAWMIIRQFIIYRLNEMYSSSVRPQAELEIVEVVVTTTPEMFVITLTPTEQPAVTTTPFEVCRSWEEITFHDVGKNLCVYGTVRQTSSDQNAFFILFGFGDESFYLVHYGDQEITIYLDDCIQVNGKIERLGEHLLMVVEPSQIEECSLSE